MLFFASGASKGFYFTPSFDDSLAAHISQLATLSAAAGKAACQSADEKRDLIVARQCSNVFGASLVSVEETD